MSRNLITLSTYVCTKNSKYACFTRHMAVNFKAMINVSNNHNLDTVHNQPLVYKVKNNTGDAIRGERDD